MFRLIRTIPFLLATAFALSASEAFAAVLLADPAASESFDLGSSPLLNRNQPVPIDHAPAKPVGDPSFPEVAFLPGGSAGGMGGSSSRGVAPPTSNAVSEDAGMRVVGGRLVYGLSREPRSRPPALFATGIFRPPRVAC